MLEPRPNGSFKLHEIYGKEEVKGIFGPELEVEYKSAINLAPPKGWHVKSDDSLRNFGVEFIALSTFTREEFQERVKEVCEYVVKQKGYIPNCPRTSFHVHYNVSNMTPVQVVNCIVAYWLIEDVVSKHCGPLRQGNQYCLSSSISSGVVDVLTSSVKRDMSELFRSLNGNNYIRYSGQNLCSVPKLMSLENRVMNGNAEDPSALIAWGTNLDSIYTRAKDFKDPSELCDFAFHNPYRFMLECCNPGFMGYYNMPESDGWIEEKLLLVSELVYETDWNKWGSSFKNQPIRKQKTLNDIQLLGDRGAANVRPLWNLDEHERDIAGIPPPVLEPLRDIPNIFKTYANHQMSIQYNNQTDTYIYTVHPGGLGGLTCTYEDYCTLVSGSVQAHETTTLSNEDMYYDGLFYGRDY